MEDIPYQREKNSVIERILCNSIKQRAKCLLFLRVSGIVFTEIMIQWIHISEESGERLWKSQQFAFLYEIS